MDGIKLELTCLNKHWDQSVLETAAVDPGLLGKPESASARPPVGFTTDGPSRHREEF